MSFPVSRNSTVALVSRSDASNFLNAFECPVMAESLENAVVLAPCGHTISEVAANYLYHGMRTVGGVETAETQAPCPLCRRKVTAYYSNQIVRSLTEMASDMNLEEVLRRPPATIPAEVRHVASATTPAEVCHVASATISAEVCHVASATTPAEVCHVASATTPAKVRHVASATIPAHKKRDRDTVPFPGIGAKFVLIRGAWDIEDFGNGINFVRRLSFESKTEGSLFDRMAVLGYKDGRVAISLNFRTNRKIAIRYLLKCGIDVGDDSKETGNYQSNASNTKRLFGIIAKYNEIPADKFSLIRDLVASGNWNDVTPITEDDRFRAKQYVGSYSDSCARRLSWLV